MIRNKNQEDKGKFGINTWKTTEQIKTTIIKPCSLNSRSSGHKEVHSPNGIYGEPTHQIIKLTWKNLS